jgi:murein lipoprotein
MTMNVRTALTLSAVFMLSLSGCATQSQVDQQTRQLIEVNNTLKQIQAAQQVSIALQQNQVSLQVQGNAQALQRQAGSR